ncbi:ATP-binding cassette domain-containing protein [Actinocorallia sp. API 0066]|uniref:ATP-binding cassette domain-containing protein n=1 Tax=Actinocorallia sp. API 0066 TaxID=2896846 RepID=UPI001E44A9C2|nr:ATP-binding cassette domain-containing protein [Actinocorallia sp. API 0066]MCD0453341.1 ATP-binding cassette domain-containing protein [Actinocorallia sp. API 0066]
MEQVDLTIERGQIVALVGPNGSGKTTLAKILAALYAPATGTIHWNGIDAARFDPAHLRSRIAAVFQDFQSFSETIAENVAFGDLDRETDRDRIGELLEIVGFAAGELDLDQLIGPEHDGGTALSGGQAQRLAIARALYRDADLLILDEPTSALDARSEHGLLAALRAMGRTTILISHRLANVAESDRILVFAEGRIIESGTHADLMTGAGVYRELYSLQADLYTPDDS